MNKERHAILFNDAQLGPYPMEKLTRVDTPTTKYVGKIEQRGENMSAEVKLAKGEFGEKARLGATEFIDKEPIFRAFFDVNTHISNLQLEPVAKVKSELPNDTRCLLYTSTIFHRINRRLDLRLLAVDIDIAPLTAFNTICNTKYFRTSSANQPAYTNYFTFTCFE